MKFFELPKFDDGLWFDQAIPRDGRPQQFTLETVSELIVTENGEFTEETERVIMGGREIAIVNASPGGPDPRIGPHPLYFETTGRRYHYVISVWADLVSVAVCTKVTFETESTMFPRTRQELERAFDTVGYDAAA